MTASIRTASADAQTRRIRVLYVLDGYTDPHAGTETQFWLLLRQLDRTRFEPRILLLRRSEFLETHAGDIPVSVLDVGSLRSPRAMWRILCAALRARRDRIDVAHLFFNDVSLVFPPLLRVLGIPVIVSRRDLGFWYTRGNLPLLRLNAPFVSCVVANCEAVRRAVMDAERYSADKVLVIYNGISREPARPGRDVRSELSLSPDAPLLAIVANLRPLKRVDDAIRALAVVAQAFPEVCLAVVGEDRPGASGVSARQELQALAEELGVAERLRFLGKLEDPMPVMAAADVCLLCSETEGLSNVVIEYMFAGKPVVCTDVGGNSELVVEGQTGHLVPVGDVEGLARAISGLLDDRARARAFGEAARRRALELFEPSAMVKRHESLYARLAARGETAVDARDARHLTAQNGSG